MIVHVIKPEWWRHYRLNREHVFQIIWEILNLGTTGAFRIIHHLRPVALPAMQIEAIVNLLDLEILELQLRSGILVMNLRATSPA
jgi:hypothetical protein